MRRRAFLGILGSAVVSWPLVVHAQGERVRRIGILMPFPPTNAEMQARVRAFRDELRKRGWAAGVNVQFDERWTGDNMDLIRSAAKNLVELNPDAILASRWPSYSHPDGIDARRYRLSFPAGADPVGRGYAESLARPGRNVTGFVTMELSVISKMLQTLKEIAPNITHISMIYNPDNPVGVLFVRSFQSAAGPLGVEPTVIQIHGLARHRARCSDAAARPNGGIFVPLDVTIIALAEQTAAAIARHRLPAIYSERQFVTKGGLVYYGTDRIATVSWRRLVCGSYFARRETRRSALPAANQVRIGDQFTDRQSARFDHSPETSVYCRRSDRMTGGHVRFWHKADIPSCTAHVRFQG